MLRWSVAFGASYVSNVQNGYLETLWLHRKYFLCCIWANFLFLWKKVIFLINIYFLLLVYWKPRKYSPFGLGGRWSQLFRFPGYRHSNWRGNANSYSPWTSPHSSSSDWLFFNFFPNWWNIFIYSWWPSRLPIYWWNGQKVLTHFIGKLWVLD